MPRLADIAPELERSLIDAPGLTSRYPDAAIRRETVRVAMRDGVRLATDLYLPPDYPAPAIAVRTPYGRAGVELSTVLVTLARHGYAVIAQDCRGTGDSEPASWDSYVFEREDSFDFVEWAVHQPWFDGFLGACGGSYLAQTQWCMALHPKVSAVAPEVSGLGVGFSSARLYMVLNAYARSVGKGEGKIRMPLGELERLMLGETLAGGYFNEPLHRPLANALLERHPNLRTLSPSHAKRWLWKHYSSLDAPGRAGLIKEAFDEANVTAIELETSSAIFGQHIAIDSHTIPCANSRELAESLQAPTLMITGWYDWALNDALETWGLIAGDGRPSVRSRSRLVIAPSAHNVPGYHEGVEDHPELSRPYRTPYILDLLVRWYAALRDGSLDSWPTVIYYLMGANNWRASSAWPPPETQQLALYLGSGGTLRARASQHLSSPDTYIYDPNDPTPTVGGSVLSYVYHPGSVDVSHVQQRSDVLTYTTEVFEDCLDVAGPLRVILYASSNVVDTDFCARLSDVFPDGRAIQVQNGILRTRYRERTDDPQLLEPHRIYRLEIDMWATANRFARGHRLRLDISSADFPRFDRNANRGGEPGPPICALQAIHHDPEHPSHLLLSVTGNPSIPGLE